MSKKPKVQFVQNEEPSFIRQFKERAGIPTADTIESKHTELSIDDNDDDNRPDDEQPQIVYDPCSDVHELEARAFIKQWQYEHKLGYVDETNIKDEKPGVPSRIMFRSAEERSDSKNPVNRSDKEILSSNRPPAQQQHKKFIRDRSPLESKRKDTKCSLLSFDLDEDEG